MIKHQKTKESDKILTVLTNELGVISIYAKGAMRLKNKFHSAVSLFTYSEFVLFESNNSKLYQLNEVSIKKVFHKLGEDIEKLSTAMYLAEICTEVIVKEEASNDILRLFLNILHTMCEEKWSTKLSKAAFEMRILCDVGYRPNFIHCSLCNKSEEELYYFLYQTGKVLCKNCYTQNLQEESLICDKATVYALRYLAYADLEKMFSFNLSGNSLINLSKICEKYMLYHTKQNYKTLDFLNTLNIQ